MAFEIVYSPAAEIHLRSLTPRQRAIVLDTVDVQLSHQPAVKTRHRKRLRGESFSTWQLSIGDLRVYYDVRDEPEKTVRVSAIGIKKGNKVFIEGQERVL